ncbi:MAG: c-type cytochrome [Gammaproteobacteria bacterium]
MWIKSDVPYRPDRLATVVRVGFSAMSALPFFARDRDVSMIRRGLLLVICCALVATQVSIAGGTIGRTIGVACSACHGPQGRSEGAIPSIHGLPAKQIESAMRDFRSGKRPGTIMNRISKGYTNNQIAAIAQYFANQKP